MTLGCIRGAAPCARVLASAVTASPSRPAAAQQQASAAAPAPAPAVTSAALKRTAGTPRSSRWPVPHVQSREGTMDTSSMACGGGA